MKLVLKLASLALAASTTSAFAFAIDVQPIAVPEISALDGAAALAVVVAVVLLVWERRRAA
jgi:hypothetical protein